MHAEPVDPRDTVWEEMQPAYRVCFWRHQFEAATAGWMSDEWRLTDADIVEVLAWAHEQADERHVTIWVEHNSASGQPGLIHLLGSEPTREENNARALKG